MTSETNAYRRDLSRRVRDMAVQYVRRRSDEKSPIKWEEFKDKRITDPATGRQRIDYPDEYRRAHERVCDDAFLALRACRSREDFVTYFTGTICSVPQYLPEGDYFALAEVLLSDGDRWEDARALAMLTISAEARL